MKGPPLLPPPRRCLQWSSWSIGHGLGGVRTRQRADNRLLYLTGPRWPLVELRLLLFRLKCPLAFPLDPLRNRFLLLTITIALCFSKSWWLDLLCFPLPPPCHSPPQCPFPGSEPLRGTLLFWGDPRPFPSRTILLLAPRRPPHRLWSRLALSCCQSRPRTFLRDFPCLDDRLRFHHGVSNPLGRGCYPTLAYCPMLVPQRNQLNPRSPRTARTTHPFPCPRAAGRCPRTIHAFYPHALGPERG
jgi:hypothetical protein